MKCLHCNGNIIIEKAHHLYPERRRCLQCGREPTEEQLETGSVEKPSIKTHFYQRNGKLQKVIDSILSGNGIKKTARNVGVSTWLASKVYHELSKKTGIYCKCGQEITHRGWCHYRYIESPKRQEFIKNWGSVSV